MTETTDLMDGSGVIGPVTGGIVDEKQLAQQLLAQAKAQGMGLLGPGGLLSGLTKTVLETGLDAELTEHLGMSTVGPRWGRTGVTGPAPRRC